MIVPNAAHKAVTKNIATQMIALEGAGRPRKTATPQSVENAKGQISRGRDLPVASQSMRVASATRALKGKSKMMETSTRNL
jgi:hypothetical protein